MPQAQNGNYYAKIRLYEMYLRVAVRQAYELSNRFHLSFEDTLQDGFVGAISSVDNYDSSEHMAFSMTIQWRISQAMCRNRWLYNNPCYFPTFLRDKLFSIMEEVEEHFCEHCPKYEDVICNHLALSISEKNDWTVEEATINIKYLKSFKSLDETLENEDDISDDGLFAYEMNNELEESLDAKTLPLLLETIKPREKEVILYRYGFTEKGVLTLEAVGQIMGVTRERVRQLEEKALKRLRHPTRTGKLIAKPSKGEN